MSFNLIDSVRDLLGGDLIPKASARLHEDETRLQYALSGIVPAILAGIIHKAGTGDAGRMLAMAKDTANSGMLSGISDMLGENRLLERGTDLLKSIFGSHLNDVANSVSNFAAIKSSSATALMSMAAPAALGTIGAHAASTNMDERSFVSYLDSHKESVLSALPSRFNLAGAMGLGSIGNLGTRLTGAIPGTTSDVREVHRMKRKPTAWVLPVVVILAALGLVWYFTTLNDDDKREDTVTATQNEPGRIATPPPSGETVNVKLPNGVELNARRNGIEHQLVNFLNDPAKKVDDNTWFDFDRLNFETGSSMITAESMPQIRNIAAILKAFPNASIKIGGYTDVTGNEPVNLKLSQSRAEAVVAALRNNGISEAQLSGAEGYGSKFAKAPADAPDEERRMDRRISVSVRRK
jgi:outer membrane protein OmpA-like peptidoglycan-associated protein